MEKNEKVVNPKISFQFKSQFEFSTASLARLVEFIEATEKVENNLYFLKMKKALEKSRLTSKRLPFLDLLEAANQMNYILNELNQVYGWITDEFVRDPYGLIGWLDSTIASFDYADELLQDDMKGGE